MGNGSLAYLDFYHLSIRHLDGRRAKYSTFTLRQAGPGEYSHEVEVFYPHRKPNKPVEIYVFGSGKVGEEYVPYTVIDVRANLLALQVTRPKLTDRLGFLPSPIIRKQA